MGGSETKVYQPTPPAAPTTGDAINEWVAAQPQVFAQQQEFAPQEAQQQLELLQQYGLPMAQAYKQAQDALYPETTALQEQLAGQASEGMSAEVPDWMADKYRSEMAANLGSNVGSGIGADYMSRGMVEQQHNYQNYYRNLGLSIAGRQPLAQAQAPQTSNFMGQFGPTSNFGMMSQNYGTYAGASRPEVGFMPSQTGQIVGGLAQGLGALGGGYLAGR